MTGSVFAAFVPPELDEDESHRDEDVCAASMIPKRRNRYTGCPSRMALSNNAGLDALRQEAGRVGESGERPRMPGDLHDQAAVVHDQDASSAPRGPARFIRALKLLEVLAKKLAHIGRPRSLPRDAEDRAGRTVVLPN